MHNLQQTTFAFTIAIDTFVCTTAIDNVLCTTATVNFYLHYCKMLELVVDRQKALFRLPELLLQLKHYLGIRDKM